MCWKRYKCLMKSYLYAKTVRRKEIPVRLTQKQRKILEKENMEWCFWGLPLREPLWESTYENRLVKELKNRSTFCQRV